VELLTLLFHLLDESRYEMSLFPCANLIPFSSSRLSTPVYRLHCSIGFCPPSSRLSNFGGAQGLAAVVNEKCIALGAQKSYTANQLPAAPKSSLVLPKFPTSTMIIRGMNFRAGRARDLLALCYYALCCRITSNRQPHCLSGPRHCRLCKISRLHNPISATECTTLLTGLGIGSLLDSSSQECSSIDAHAG
jgi:hypothetical protein